MDLYFALSFANTIAPMLLQWEGVMPSSLTYQTIVKLLRSILKRIIFCIVAIQVLLGQDF